MSDECEQPEIKLDNKDDKGTIVDKLTINIDGSPIGAFALPTGVKVNQKFLEHAFDTDKRVPDVHRYNLMMNDNELVLETPGVLSFIPAKFVEKSKYYDRKLTIANAESFKGAIVILLESPHMDEYDKEFNPIAPAQGATGDALDIYLASILSHFAEKGKWELGKYPVLLINPIPYQCSLGHVVKAQKNKSEEKKAKDKSNLKEWVWETLWGNCIYFQSYLSELLENINPVLILNLCTENLKGKIVFGDFAARTWNGPHPSAWTRHNTLRFNQMRVKGKKEGYFDFEYDRKSKKAFRVVIRKA